MGRIRVENGEFGGFKGNVNPSMRTHEEDCGTAIDIRGGNRKYSNKMVQEEKGIEATSFRALDWNERGGRIIKKELLFLLFDYYDDDDDYSPPPILP